MKALTVMACAACFAMLAGCSGQRIMELQTQLAAAQEENEQAAAAIKSLEAQLDEKEKVLSEYEKVMLALEDKKSAAESKVEILSGDLDKQRTEVTRQKDTAMRTEQRLTDAQATVKSLQTELQKQKALTAEFEKEREELAKKVQVLMQEIDALNLEIKELKGE